MIRIITVLLVLTYYYVLCPIRIMIIVQNC